MPLASKRPLSNKHPTWQLLQTTSIFTIFTQIIICTSFTPKYFAEPLSLITRGMTVKSRRNWKQWLCKILGGKQGTLWSMWKWWTRKYSGTLISRTSIQQNPQYNKWYSLPQKLYNNVKNNLDEKKPPYSGYNLPVPWAFIISRFHSRSIQSVSCLISKSLHIASCSLSSTK